jgi:co-chaperonin GroES (HSP10)
MNLKGLDIESLRLISGDCIIELHSLTEDEINFNGGKLKIVNKIKNYISEVDENYMFDLVDGMKKSRYKDKNLMKEYNRIVGESKREADEDKEDIQGKQAVRRGRIVKISEVDLGEQGWDYQCEFDAVEGDEVWFDATFTREMITEGEGGCIIDGKTYLTISKKSIYAAKRGDEIISLNGYVIGKLLGNERKNGSIHLVDNDLTKVEVVVPPARIPKYNQPNVWTNTEVSKGDVVCVRRIHAIKLDPTLANTTEYVRFQPRVIMAYVK